jgi:hypothetical protein
MTRPSAIKRLLEYRLESWDADDTQKMIRVGCHGLSEMSNLELEGLWQDWFEEPITVTGKEPLTHRRIEQSVLEALVTALTHITACVSMRGPAGTTGYLISDDRMQTAKDALARVNATPATQGSTHAT